MWQNPLALDVETTTFQKGNPFSRQNKLCTVGHFDGTTYIDYDIEYTNTPYGKQLESIKEAIEKSDLLIGFNIKFDLHWLRRYLDNLLLPAVWDSQLAEFLLCGQTQPYPSLSGALDRFILDSKHDRVRTEFWDNGIDTTEIPWDILSEYQKQDVIQTYKLYLKQKEQFEQGNPKLYELFKLQCKDLLILEEAEFNGMKLNVQQCNERASKYSAELRAIRESLESEIGDSRINFGSPDHISVLLYGGRITFKVRERYERVLKDGTRKERERWGTTEVEFERLVTPLARSEQAATRKMSDDELKRENQLRINAGRRPLQRLYSTDEHTLRGTKCKGKAKRIIDLLLRYSEIEKLVSTYYGALPKLIETMDWPEDELHGQFNQCVVVTGRLSSSKPNLQNLAGETKSLYISRYDD